MPRISVDVARIDSGPRGSAGRAVQTAWVTLTHAEATELLATLRYWAEERAEGLPDVGWHEHFTDSDQNELTIEIDIMETVDS